MTPLLEAAVAAREVGLEMPKCDRCEGRGRYHCCPEHLCDWCDATGLDASDPERLIGRAMMWLWSRNSNITDAEYPNISAAARDAETGCGMRGLKLFGYYRFERHDGSPTSLATALLRLVARVGGKT